MFQMLVLFPSLQCNEKMESHLSISIVTIQTKSDNSNGEDNLLDQNKPSIHEHYAFFGSKIH